LGKLHKLDFIFSVIPVRFFYLTVLDSKGLYLEVSGNWPNIKQNWTGK